MSDEKFMFELPSGRLVDLHRVAYIGKQRAVIGETSIGLGSEDLEALEYVIRRWNGDRSVFTPKVPTIHYFQRVDPEHPNYDPPRLITEGNTIFF